MRGKMSSPAFTAKNSDFAVSAEVEYLIPQSAVSLFAGARYASQNIKTTVNSVVLTDTQEFIGLRYSFGAGAPSSLQARDRSGAYDNTSVFQEKIPDISSGLPFS